MYDWIKIDGEPFDRNIRITGGGTSLGPAWFPCRRFLKNIPIHSNYGGSIRISFESYYMQI
ncbi:hypothetical protein DK846_09305 [Methanospirillum lacunae]|uniref:Uncharacterized protein n=1 Tax=Methanospirillum lacunae TaxID=668570 RepID=A0A2V2NA78_9EURY|nr:hypothetical protein DK846_09305 [Methanospirillum lacunae]